MTATHFSDGSVLLAASASAAFSGSSSDVRLSSVSASAPLVFSDSDVVVESDAGDASAGAVAARRLLFARASFFSLSLSSFSAFCSAHR